MFLMRSLVAMKGTKLTINGGFEASFKAEFEMKVLVTGIVFGTTDADEVL